MEKQKLPNSTLILVFGILSILTCCCYGIIGLALGIIAIVLANKATAIYAQNPDEYSGFSNVKTGKTLAIIGVILSSIYVIATIYFYVTIGSEGIQEMQQQWMEQMQNQ